MLVLGLHLLGRIDADERQAGFDDCARRIYQRQPRRGSRRVLLIQNADVVVEFVECLRQRDDLPRDHKRLVFLRSLDDNARELLNEAQHSECLVAVQRRVVRGSIVSAISFAQQGAGPGMCILDIRPSFAVEIEQAI